jgi:26S proteasome regulatory subunit N2
LGLSFLHKNSDSDRLIMENLKKALEERGGGRNSVLHNCAVVTHSYLNAGTTNDSFLRDNLDWMRKASNWAKFSATSSLGVLHAGHITEAMSLLEPYLPSNTAAEDPSGGFAEGGSLYALGIIHGSHSGGSATKRKEANDFLRNHLRSSHANEPISHGAALGVGLTAFGTNDLEIVNELKELLYTDSAVAGEGAGLAIGMVLVGSGAGNVENNLDPSIAEEIAEIITELKNYAKETQHEKIIRGIAMGLALINFGQEEHADPLIDEMRNNRDPVLRYGAQYALALAYCGTGSNKAIRILLHTAVSDANDDVRMAAVLGLAFVLYKTPDRVPQLVKLLLESFNPHVRYASCMAVGIAMAGSGDSESVALLEPMLSDMTDFVRQGALLGTALIYMQQNDACNGKKIKSFRDKLISIIGDKHQTSLTKMGAILATGIIDAGGRNCSFDLGSKNGFTKVTSAVGVALWLQHWYWFPLMHMFSLAITPTYTIGLNKDFKYPKNFEIICNSKPSVFSYPKRLEEKKEEKKKRIETVTLSTTAKTKAREARKKAKEEGESGPEKMVVEEVKTEEKEEGMEIDSDETKTKKTKREPEPNSFKLSNPCRITKAQEPLCAFDSNQRYRAVYHDERPSGVIMLTDSTPGNEEDLGTVKPPSVEAEDEADPPEPFEWTPPGHPDYVSSD